MKPLAILLFVPLIVSCVSPSENKSGFFKQYVETVEKDKTKEYSFFTLYDNESNRFSLTFGYGLHFFYEIKIVEYDLTDWYHYPNEGVFADDYESVTFNLDARSESELFVDGKYVLSHEIKNNEDVFFLSFNDEIISLTKEPKISPKYINPNLVGDFTYEDKFDISISVGSLKDKRPVNVSLIENETNYATSNYVINDNSMDFVINGENGTYITEGNATLSYASNQVTLINNENTYLLTKKEQKGDSYFGNEELTATFSNEYVSITLGSLVGSNRRFLNLNELKEGGKKNIYALFAIEDDGDTLKNEQNLSGNLVFTSNSTIKLVHSIKNNKDKIDLYKDNVLLYENLNIL